MDFLQVLKFVCKKNPRKDYLRKMLRDLVTLVCKRLVIFHMVAGTLSWLLRDFHLNSCSVLTYPKWYWRNREMWTWLPQVFISKKYCVFSKIEKKQLLSKVFTKLSCHLPVNINLNHSSKSPAVFETRTLKCQGKFYSIVLCNRRS